ncbi:glycine-rich RNA-binding protein 8-like [Vespula squamosa]|uniref:Glycine-rich RNA-binding protein 8-like n=1 Tax=Vespula squamosa TaxID=30214 RepID=A0ABD1ZUS8_VESSQ
MYFVSQKCSIKILRSKISAIHNMQKVPFTTSAIITHIRRHHNHYHRRRHRRHSNAIRMKKTTNFIVEAVYRLTAGLTLNRLIAVLHNINSNESQMVAEIQVTKLLEKYNINIRYRHQKGLEIRELLFRCDDCTQDKRKSWESNWSTERIDIAQGEALAEECHDAIDDELDDETPANQWGGGGGGGGRGGGGGGGCGGGCDGGGGSGGGGGDGVVVVAVTACSRE